MTVTVLDSTNLNAIVAEATGEPLEVEKPEVKAEEKAEEGKPEEKAEAKEDEKAETKGDEKKEETDPDDVEGEDGLTPRQKREYSKSMLKSIGKKHRQMKEAEEFAAAQYNERKLAEQRAADLERQLAAARPQVEETKQEAKEPQPDDYKTQKEYVDAVIEFKVNQQMALRDAQRAHDEMINSAKSRINKAIEIVPNYREVIDKAGDLAVPPAIANYMQKSPMIAELSYHFAEHPDVLKSLQNMTPEDQLVTIGEIKATLKPFSESQRVSESKPNGDKPSSTEAKKDETASEILTGKAPSKARNTAPVIQPLSSAGTVDKELADMNIREHIVDWQKRQGTNLNLRKRH